MAEPAAHFPGRMVPVASSRRREARCAAMSRPPGTTSAAASESTIFRNLDERVEAPRRAAGLPRDELEAPHRAAMTLKARVAKLCEELGVEPPSGGGLAPTVRLCAAAAEVPYETIGKTVEALELEVFGVAAVAPAAATTPADKKKRKRAVKRETGCTDGARWY